MGNMHAPGSAAYHLPGAIQVLLNDGSVGYATAIESPIGIFRGGTFDLGGENLGEFVGEMLDAAEPILDNGWIGETLLDGSPTVEGWPSSFGGAALTPGGAGSHFLLNRSARTGRKCASSASSADRALLSATGVAKSIVVVYEPAYYAPPGVNHYLAATAAGVYPLACGSGNQQWQTGAGYGNPAHYRDGLAGAGFDTDVHVYQGDVAANVATGLKLGGFNGFAFCVIGNIYAAFQLTAVPSAAQMLNMAAAARKYYGIQQSRGLFIDGNSIPAGYTGGPANVWWGTLQMPNVARWNIAVSGRELVQVEAAMVASFAAHDTRGYRDIVYVLYEDINSYLHTHWTAAQVVSKNWDIAAAARAAGFKVILSTCMPSTSLIPADELSRQAANATKLAQWPQHADGIIDWASMPQFANPAGPYFFDGLHPSTVGYRLFGETLRRAVLALP